MVFDPMKPHGTYKLAYRARGLRSQPQEPFAPHAPGIACAAERFLAGYARREQRVRRILESLRSQILSCGGRRSLRIRRVFVRPREIYRVEIELPELGYQRTTLLDRDALEELLEADDVREVVASAASEQ